MTVRTCLDMLWTHSSVPRVNGRCIDLRNSRVLSATLERCIRPGRDILKFKQSLRLSAKTQRMAYFTTQPTSGFWPLLLYGTLCNPWPQQTCGSPDHVHWTCALDERLALLPFVP